MRAAQASSQAVSQILCNVPVRPQFNLSAPGRLRAERIYTQFGMACARCTGQVELYHKVKNFLICTALSHLHWRAVPGLQPLCLWRAAKQSPHLQS